MRASSTPTPTPWRVRWLALSYAVFVLGAASYVFVWYIVTRPDGWYWAEPLCLVARPLAGVVPLIEPTPGPMGALLCVLAGAVQAALLFGVCAWIDRALARRRPSVSLSDSSAEVPDLRRLGFGRADQAGTTPGRGGDDNVARGTSI
jgi:hypothetical protein